MLGIISLNKEREYKMNAWECHRCGAINAPWKGQCSCVKPEQNHIGVSPNPSPTVIVNSRCMLCNVSHSPNLPCLYPYSLCL